jgi:hypothetical protein
MQLDGAGASPNPRAGWGGAPAVLRRVLQSMTLPPAAPLLVAQRPAVHGHAPQHPQHGAAPREQRGASSTAAAAAQAAAKGGAAAGDQPCAAPQQALRLLAMLRERQAHGILSHLIQSPDDGGAGGTISGEGLCQKLIQLLEAASAQQGPDAATAPLFPAQFPSGPPELAGPAGQGTGDAATACLAAQLEWQQRLRLAQEALSLMRGLLMDDALGGLPVIALLLTALRIQGVQLDWYQWCWLWRVAGPSSLASRKPPLQMPRPLRGCTAQPARPLALWKHFRGHANGT